MNFHSQAFTQTAPLWYRVAVFLWYAAGIGMVAFLGVGLLFRDLRLRWVNRLCGWGWGLSTLLFVFPMIFNSCIADSRP